MMIENWNLKGYEQETERSKRGQTVERGDYQRNSRINKNMIHSNIATCDNKGTEINDGETDKRQPRN